MPRNDDYDDYSHLPTVDGLASERQAAEPAVEARPEPKAAERHEEKKIEPPREPEAAPAADREQHMVEDRLERAKQPAPPPARVPDWALEALAGGKRSSSRREQPVVGGLFSGKAAAHPAPQPAAMPHHDEPPAKHPQARAAAPDWVKEAFGQQAAEKKSRSERSGREQPVAEKPAKPAQTGDSKPAASEKADARDDHRSRDRKEAPVPEAKDPKLKTDRDAGHGKDADDAGEAKKEAADASHPQPPHLPHDEPRPLTRKEKLRLLYEKWGGRSLLWSVGLHLVLLIIAAIVVVQQTMEDEIDSLPGGSAAAQQASEQLEHQVQRKKLRKTLTQNPQLKRVVSLSQNAALSLPEAPPDMFDLPNDGMLSARDLTRGMGGGGMGGGFGKGLGVGGKITFLGNTATGRHIIFVVDVSASMSALSSTSNGGRRISRFDLLKEELNKSLSRLPAGTAYQVIYFSDFAWPHNELDTRNLKAFEKYQWEITTKNTNVRIPSFRYLKADMLSILRSRDVINASDNPGGTNWGSGLLMALKGVPKPDFIFFMTDGNRADAEGWVDIVTNYNMRMGRKTIIHTTAMMEPDAARELDDLAKRNGGNFTIVNADGSITTSKDYFGK